MRSLACGVFLAGVFLRAMAQTPGEPIPSKLIVLQSQILAYDQQCDRFSAEIRHRMFTVDRTIPLDAWTDSAAWRAHPAPALTFRVKVAKPNAIIHFVTDRPEDGYEPVKVSICQERYISRHDRPGPDGLTHFETTDGGVQAGLLRWCPLLQVLGLHMHDSSADQLTLKALVRSERGESSVTELESGGCAFTAFDQADDTEYELYGSEEGELERLISKQNIEGGQPIVWDQRVVETLRWKDMNFPRRVNVLVDNPNVPLSYRVVHDFSITKLEQLKSTPEALCLDIEKRNSRVVTLSKSAPARHEEFRDAAPQPAKPGARFWLWGLGAAAALGALLFHVTRRV
jgi:hypothetical protein